MPASKLAAMDRVGKSFAPDADGPLTGIRAIDLSRHRPVLARETEARK